MDNYSWEGGFKHEMLSTQAQEENESLPTPLGPLEWQLHPASPFLPNTGEQPK